MTTLTDFLLARIAEDEAVAFRARGTGYDLGYRLAAGEWEGNDSGVEITPDRVLAECAAKRRIVDALIDMEPVEPERRDQVVTLRWACMALTLPYADHPEYDPAWRDADD